MKKILYTLLIALVVISCNKEEIGSGNTPLSLSQEITAVDVNDFDGIIDRLLSKKGSLTSKNSNASTSKSATAGSFIKAYVINADTGNVRYEILHGDDVTTCTPNGVTPTELFLIYQSSSLINLSTTSDSADAIANIENVDLTFAFEFDGLFLGDEIDFDNKTITPGTVNNLSISF